MNVKVRAWIFRILTGIGAASAVATGALYKSKEAGEAVTWVSVGADPIIVLLMVGAFTAGIMQFREK